MYATKAVLLRIKSETFRMVFASIYFNLKKEKQTLDNMWLPVLYSFVPINERLKHTNDCLEVR